MKSILYSGYANSGGTIIGLIFEEIENAVVLPMEFRLLKERFGLCELEDALFKSKDPEVIDLAIKDFEWLCRQYATSIGRFNRSGYSYNARSGNIFNEATKKYINSLVDFDYPKSWHFYDFSLSYLELIFQRLIRKLVKNSNYGKKSAYLAYPDSAVFLRNTKLYLDTILKGFLNQQIHDQQLKKSNDSFVVLPKSVPLYSQQSVKQIVRYFEDCKMILIDRDPRDIFLEILRGKQRYLPEGNDLIKKAKGFITYYRAVRAEQNEVKSHPSVLLVQFEDVVLDYDIYLKKMYEFLDISPDKHSKRGSLFKPEESIRNIALWENNHEVKAAVQIIESELKEYLYIRK